MPRIAPSQVNQTLKSAQRDGVVTDQEAGKVIRAALKDLAKSDDGAATLKLASENLRAFLEPFARRDSQEEGGVRLGRSARYELTDAANALERAAEQIAKETNSAFGFALGLSITDGKLTVHEARDSGKIAEKLLASAADPVATAKELRGALLEVESYFAQLSGVGMGPSRDEIVTPASSKELSKLNALLGQAIAKGLEGTSAVEAVDPNGIFAETVREILTGSYMERGMLLENLPKLVDQEVGVYDSTGLVGPAKLAMERQTEARGRALLGYVEGLSGDTDELQQALYRVVTGRFMPDSAKPEFLTMLASLPERELHRAIDEFQSRAKELESADSFSVKNERKGLLEGVALLEAELLGRADASGLSSLGTDADKAAILTFLKADPNMVAALADGAKLDEGSVKTFSWAEARAAVKGDHSPDANLDVVLQNMTNEHAMLRRDLPEAYAFARVSISFPDEEPFPLTIVLKRGDDGFAPVRIADGGIPFDS